MTSKRKSAKLTKMNVRKVLMGIDKYTKDYTYKYANGHFIYTFREGHFNLHITFDKLPEMKFAIWSINGWHYFAECIPYIDKFKPGRCEFEWPSFEAMMDTVTLWLNNKEKYISDLEERYCSNSPFFPLNYQEILDDYKLEKFKDAHNGFTLEEYQTYLKKFNELVRSLDVNKIDFFWNKSIGYHHLYDVHYFLSPEWTYEEIGALENKLKECKCFSWGGRPLSPHFFKHKSEYKYKIHPDVYNLYFNQKRHLRYFRHNK